MVVAGKFVVVTAQRIPDAARQDLLLELPHRDIIVVGGAVVLHHRRDDQRRDILGNGGGIQMRRLGTGYPRTQGTGQEKPRPDQYNPFVNLFSFRIMASLLMLFRVYVKTRFPSSNLPVFQTDDYQVFDV